MGRLAFYVIYCHLPGVDTAVSLEDETFYNVCSLTFLVVLYGSETWTMCKVDSDRIQSFHMQALRRILGIRWYEKVSYPTQ